MDPLLLAGIGIAIVVGGIVVLRLHAFLALILAALAVGALTPQSQREQYAEDAIRMRKLGTLTAENLRNDVRQPLGTRVAKEFGNTCFGIGILIAMASVVGKCLLDSGAADKIVRTTMGALGEKRAPAAFWLSGFVLGIPVFFDTVFYLMIPLAKAARLRSGKDYFIYIAAIVAGGTITHSMVPPTPGPLIVANQLGVDLGQMMIGGMIVGIMGSAVGYAYSLWMNSRIDVPLRDTPDATVAELTEISQRDERTLPPFLLSLLPVILPVILIAGDSILRSIWPEAGRTDRQKEILVLTGILGDRNIALTISAAIALFLVVWKMADKGKIGEAVQESLASAGVIILITAAGGAFGAMLTYTGVGNELAGLSQKLGLPILLLAWAITALLRTAQGSATVAMITAAGMVGGIDLPCSPLWLALALGAGAMPFSWMNDSGFWVVNRMGGLTYSETFKSFSYVMCVMSVAAIIVVLIGSKLFPMV